MPAFEAREGAPRDVSIWIALAAAAAFAPALALPFVYDDFPLLRDNAGLASWRALAQLAGPDYYGTFGVGNYHPLPILLWAALRAAFGAVPWPFHLASLALHALNAALAYRLSRKVLGGEAAGRAAGLMWAVWPLHAQAVFVGAFFSELSCAAFCLAAAARFVESEADHLTDAPGLALFALALACKETALVLPLALAALGPVRRAPLASLRSYAYVAALYAAWRLGPIRDLELWAATRGAGSGAESALAPLVRLGEALRLEAWPRPLSLVRENPERGLLAEPVFWAAGLAWLALAAAAPRRARGAALLWTLAWLLPVLNLAPLGYARRYFAGHFLNERYLYTSSLGLAWLAAGAWARLKPGAGKAVLAAAVAAGAAGAWSESAVFREPLRLWSRAVEVAPRSLWAHDYLGLAYLERGRPSDALAEFERALACRGGAFERSIVYSNLGAALFELGRLDDARRAYRHAAAADPSNVEARRHLRLGEDEPQDASPAPDKT